MRHVITNITGAVTQETDTIEETECINNDKNLHLLYEVDKVRGYKWTVMTPKFISSLKSKFCQGVGTIWEDVISSEIGKEMKYFGGERRTTK